MFKLLECAQFYCCLLIELDSVRAQLQSLENGHRRDIGRQLIQGGVSHRQFLKVGKTAKEGIGGVRPGDRFQLQSSYMAEISRQRRKDCLSQIKFQRRSRLPLPATFYFFDSTLHRGMCSFVGGLRGCLPDPGREIRLERPVTGLALGQIAADVISVRMQKPGDLIAVEGREELSSAGLWRAQMIDRAGKPLQQARMRGAAWLAAEHAAGTPDRRSQPAFASIVNDRLRAPGACSDVGIGAVAGHRILRTDDTHHRCRRGRGIGVVQNLITVVVDHRIEFTVEPVKAIAAPLNAAEIQWRAESFQAAARQWHTDRLEVFQLMPESRAGVTQQHGPRGTGFAGQPGPIQSCLRIFSEQHDAAGYIGILAALVRSQAVSVAIRQTARRRHPVVFQGLASRTRIFNRQRGSMNGDARSRLDRVDIGWRW
ncbi:hypothetical protein D3C72_509360 [compost metagenome]